VGAQSGAEFEVSTYTLSYLQFAAIASSSGGDFVIAWDSAYDGSYGDGSSRGVFAQRFSSAGQRLGAAFQVNTYTLSDQRGAEIAIRDNGDFVIAWTGQHEEYFIPKAYARIFSSTGVGLATEFSVNAYTPLNKFGPSIAIGEEGEFVMAWSSYRQDGYRSSVFGRRFAFPIELDVDGDGETDALTDGLLVLRHLFGISGATLVAGAVDTASCSRCSAESVGAALDALHPVLDADGDGELTALTDGLLVLRYLFGLRGAALINGAVDADCTRCDAPSIEAYLEPLAT
jgi:hypothetical protein